MTRREMKERIRELEKRVARLEDGPTWEEINDAYPQNALGDKAPLHIIDNGTPAIWGIFTEA